MTDRALLPNRARNGFVRIEYRPGTLDEKIIESVWLGDEYHLEHLADDLADRVVIDVGANIGATTLRLLDLGVRQVLAFEPEAENVQMWQRNVSLDDQRVSLGICAVGDPAQASSVDIVGTGGDAYAVAGTRSTVIDFATMLDMFDRASPYGVPSMNTERVGLLKVDVEGSEYAWFRTATPTMLDRIDRIAMEFHGLDKPMVRPGDYGALLTLLGATHSVSVFGDPSSGGMLYAHHY